MRRFCVAVTLVFAGCGPAGPTLPQHPADPTTPADAKPAARLPADELGLDQIDEVLGRATAARGKVVDRAAIPANEWRQRVFGGGLVVAETADTRWKVSNYDDGRPRGWWTEALENGDWVRHGAEVYWQLDGKREELTRKLGEPHGDCWYYDAEGKLVNYERYNEGIVDDARTKLTREQLRAEGRLK